LYKKQLEEEGQNPGQKVDWNKIQGEGHEELAGRSEPYWPVDY